MRKKKNVVNLAIDSSKRKGRTAINETEEVVIDNEQKAKKTVDELLKDVPMDLNDKDGLLELDNEKIEEKGDDDVLIRLHYFNTLLTHLMEINEQLIDSEQQKILEFISKIK